MQIVINGLVSGLTLAVLAAAFSAVYLPTRVFHLALGGVYAGAPFIAWMMLQCGFKWPTVGPVVLVSAGLLSGLCEMLNHARLEHRKAAPGLHLVSSLGIYLIIVQSIVLFWGNGAKVLRAGVDTVFASGGVTLALSQVIAAAISSALLTGYFFWLRFSDLGLRMRALAENPTQLALFGYNTDRLRVLSFAISGVLCAASALVVAYDVGFDPHGGLNAVVLAVVAVIIGGRQSLFWGPVLGGTLLGWMRTEVSWALSSRWQEAVTFFFLGLFLYMMPNGIAGRRVRMEAQP